MRGTWYFKRSDGSYQPYDEDVAARLQENLRLQENFSPAERAGLYAPMEVDVGWGRVVRRTPSTEGERTGFVQIRDSAAERARPVVHGRAPPPPAAAEGAAEGVAGSIGAPPHGDGGGRNAVLEMAGDYTSGVRGGEQAASALVGLLDGGGAGEGCRPTRFALLPRAPGSPLRARVPTAHAAAAGRCRGRPRPPGLQPAIPVRARLSSVGIESRRTCSGRRARPPSPLPPVLTLDTPRPSFRTNRTRLTSLRPARPVATGPAGVRAAARRVRRASSGADARGRRRAQGVWFWGWEQSRELDLARADDSVSAALEQALVGGVRAPSPLPPLTKWTRLVHPSVLTGHVALVGGVRAPRTPARVARAPRALRPARGRRRTRSVRCVLTARGRACGCASGARSGSARTGGRTARC
jgi:hypothetical protein